MFCYIYLGSVNVKGGGGGWMGATEIFGINLLWSWCAKLIFCRTFLAFAGR